MFTTIPGLKVWIGGKWVGGSPPVFANNGGDVPKNQSDKWSFFCDNPKLTTNGVGEFDCEDFCFMRHQNRRTLVAVEITSSTRWWSKTLYKLDLGRRPGDQNMCIPPRPSPPPSPPPPLPGGEQF